MFFTWLPYFAVRTLAAHERPGRPAKDSRKSHRPAVRRHHTEKDGGFAIGA